MAYCFYCRKEYTDGADVCPWCGTQNEDAVPIGCECDCDCEDCLLGCSEHEDACTGNCDPGLWPLDDNGDPVRPAFLETVMGTQIDYELRLSLLQSFAIPTLREYPQTGSLGKVILGFSGMGMDIYVPENMLDFAREIVKPQTINGDDIQ